MFELARKFQTKDIELTDKYLLRTPFHPGYWAQRRLDRAIAAHSRLAHGVLLDVGCGLKPYEKFFTPFVKKYLGMEYSETSGYRGNTADFCADAMSLPLAHECVDTILCTEVLEHIPDPELVIKEFMRILRAGGTVIITAPFLCPVHDARDFFRYSPDGMAAIMKRNGFEIEKVESLSGGGITMAFLFNLYWYESGFIWTKWLYPFGVVLRPLLLPLVFIVNMLGWLGDKIIPAPQMSFDHITIGTKR
jgi:SAM-dependent methyltransferase